MLLHVWFLLCQLPMKKALHVEFDEVPHVGFIGKLKIRSVCNTYIRSKSMASRLFLTTAKTPVTPKYHCLIGQIRNHISITPTHIGQVTTEFEHGSSSSSSERSSKDTDMQVGTILWCNCGPHVSLLDGLQSPSYLPESLSTFCKEYLWGHWVTIVADSINHTPISPVPIKLSFLYRYLNMIILIMMFPRCT